MTSIENTNKGEKFKNYYTALFSVNYFFQGITQSLYAVIVPIFLVVELGGIGGDDISFMSTIVLIPFVIKFLYGMLSDKVSFKNMGRRKPWVIFPIIMSGIIWIIIPLIVTAPNAFLLFTVGGVFIFLGIAIADTAIDGLILDITPKERLGRIQGTCWGFRSVGIIAGGPLIVAILSLIEIRVVFLIYGIILILLSFTIFLVKEHRIIEQVNMVKNIKIVFGKVKNWKVFIYALFNSTVDGVIFLFVALFIIIQGGWLDLAGGEISTSILEEDITLYGINAFISFIIGLGVVAGALIGGYITDLKSRRIGVFSSLAITTISLLLFLIPAPYVILLIFAFILGSTNGWRNSAFSAVIGQISAQYPEVDSTYYATCNSFTNFGTQIGLIATGVLLNTFADLEPFAIFAIIFIFLAIISNLGIFPFLLIKRSEYEITQTAVN